MLRASLQLKARPVLTATPEGVIADLRQLLLRELEGWTAPWVKVTVAVLVSGSAAIAVEHLHEAIQHDQSTAGPLTILAALATALAILARVGTSRVRRLRRELAELGRPQCELSEDGP